MSPEQLQSFEERQRVQFILKALEPHVLLALRDMEKERKDGVVKIAVEIAEAVKKQELGSVKGSWWNLFR